TTSALRRSPMNPEQFAWQAEGFWERAGRRPSFPRDPEGVILLTLPVFIVRIPGLRPSAARGWLWQRGTRLPLAVPDRSLAGCIVAYRGRAGMFLEERLSAAETRVVLAHELAHYLADYEHRTGVRPWNVNNERLRAGSGPSVWCQGHDDWTVLQPG